MFLDYRQRYRDGVNGKLKTTPRLNASSIYPQTLDYISLKDGTSNTLMFTENIDAYNWNTDHAYVGNFGFY